LRCSRHQCPTFRTQGASQFQLGLPRSGRAPVRRTLRCHQFHRAAGRPLQPAQASLELKAVGAGLGGRCRIVPRLGRCRAGTCGAANRRACLRPPLCRRTFAATRRQHSILLDGSRELIARGGSLVAFRAPRMVPELARNVDGVDAGLFLPGGFIAHPVHQPMMDATERDREFVARFAAQGTWLHVPKVMRVGGFAAADETRLLGDVTKMRFVTITAGGRNREHALIDAVAGSIRSNALALTTADRIAGGSFEGSAVADAASASFSTKASSSTCAARPMVAERGRASVVQKLPPPRAA